MPNWCEVDLDITGPTADVRRFAKENKNDNPEPDAFGEDRHLDFNKAVPIPNDEDLLKQMEGHRTFLGEKITTDNAGYYWRIAYWGTKWNPTCYSMSKVQAMPKKKGHSRLEYGIATAWSPPEGWLLGASRKYPTLVLTMKYYEGAMGFCGSMKVQNGRILSQSHRDNYRGNRGG